MARGVQGQRLDLRRYGPGRAGPGAGWWGRFGSEPGSSAGARARARALLPPLPLPAGGLPYELTEGDVICVFSQ